MRKTVLLLGMILLLTGCGSQKIAEDDIEPSATPEIVQEESRKAVEESQEPSATPDSTPTEAPTPTPKPSAKPASTPTKAPTPAPAQKTDSEKAVESAATPTPVPAAPTSKPAPTKADAQKYVGSSVGSLTSAIGQPNSRDYAPSCLGSGEDGELFYNGFTVYTYRENGVDKVTDVR